jgi:hypothetical protein
MSAANAETYVQGLLKTNNPLFQFAPNQGGIIARVMFVTGWRPKRHPPLAGLMTVMPNPKISPVIR